MKNFFEKKPAIVTIGGAEPDLILDTIKNFKNAVSLGGEVLRTNAALTSDDKMVLFSSTFFQNPEYRRMGIHAFSLNELRNRFKNSLAESMPGTIRDDNDGIFPLMEEVLEEFPDQRFNFYLPYKNHNAVLRFCSIIKNSNAVDRIIFSSWSGFIRKHVLDIIPDIANSFSFLGIIGFYALFRTGIISAKNRFKADALIIPEIIISSYIANAGLIQEAKSRGLYVYIMDVNKKDNMMAQLEAGADGFVTNNISLVKNVFKTHNYLHNSRNSLQI